MAEEIRNGEETRGIVEPQVTALSEITRAEVDVQITTAKRYPRSVQKFRQDAMSMATIDQEIAASCFYKLSRGKGEDRKIIEGPSVRLAEIVASAWGNMRFGARVVDINDKFVVAQGVAHDLETNVSNTIEVSRRITDKYGKRYSDDMVVVTSNAACAIALRNAIFKTVPFSYAKQIYEQAKRTAVGDAKTLIERRSAMIDQFAKMSVTKEQVLFVLEKKSVEDIGLTEIETMIGIYNAIKDGDTTIEEQFNKVRSDEMPKAKTPEPVTQPDPGQKEIDAVADESFSGPASPPQKPEPSPIRLIREDRDKPDNFTIMIEQFPKAKKVLGDNAYYSILKYHGFKHSSEIKDISKGNEILKQMRDFVSGNNAEPSTSEKALINGKEFLEMKSKFPGLCRHCNKEIEKGADIYFSKAKGVYHRTCVNAQ